MENKMNLNLPRYDLACERCGADFGDGNYRTHEKVCHGTIEQRHGDFVFRPPLEVGNKVVDEILANLGNYFLHVEQMSVDGWWIGISDKDGKGIHLDFYLGEELVDDGDGKLVPPLLLRIREM